MTGKTLLGPDGRPLVRSSSLLDRRQFTGLAGAGALAAPMLAIRPAGAVVPENEDENDNPDLLQQLYYSRPGAARVILTGLILLTVSGLYYADVSQGRAAQNEDRLSLGGLFGLTRPTISENLARATAIGTAHLFGSFLVLLLAQGQRINPASMRLLVAHDQLSWLIHRLRRVSAIQGIPPEQELRALAAIGTLYFVSNALLMAILPPPDYS